MLRGGHSLLAESEVILAAGAGARPCVAAAGNATGKRQEPLAAICSRRARSRQDCRGSVSPSRPLTCSTGRNTTRGVLGPLMMLAHVLRPRAMPLRDVAGGNLQQKCKEQAARVGLSLVRSPVAQVEAQAVGLERLAGRLGLRHLGRRREDSHSAAPPSSPFSIH